MVADDKMTLYVANMSYFSGKMEGYLRYKEIPFNRRIVDTTIMRKEVLPATGLMKVPIATLPNGQWLKDTTPMIDYFESLYPDPPVVPKDPVLRFVSKLVEDYADEWCWRAALYWRWCFPESRKQLAGHIGRETMKGSGFPPMIAGPYFAKRQINVWVKGDGVDSHTKPIVEQSYLDLLDNMSLILEEQPYLLGSHPTVVDIGLFGPMFRHYSLDPEPARVMQQRAPAVFEWVARLWNAKASKMPQEQSLIDFSHIGWQYFLKDIAQSYWPFLRRNATAFANGEDRFDHQAHGVTYKNLKMIQYRVYCLEVLQNEYAQLSQSEKQSVAALFESYGKLELLEGVDSQLIDEHRLPLDGPRKIPTGFHKLLIYLNGTPREMPVRPK